VSSELLLGCRKEEGTQRNWPQLQEPADISAGFTANSVQPPP